MESSTIKMSEEEVKKEVGIPSIILEVDDEKEGCFDDSEDIAFKVMGHKASIKRISSFVYLVDNYEILAYVFAKVN